MDDASNAGHLGIKLIHSILFVCMSRLLHDLNR